MYSLLLAVIYLAFISLGLPDSLLGSAWPVMHGELGTAVSSAGMITMIISFGTIVSSLQSDRLTKRFGAGLVTAVSVMMTALALCGFSFSNSMLSLCLWAIPYGLGAGAVDAALNNYVAIHYSSRQMSWLHCMWGIGASVSPYIMRFCLTGGYGWHMGYRSVGIIQIGLTVILLLSLPMWKKRQGADGEENHSKALGLREAVKIPGVALVLTGFFAYCAMEQTSILWASSYLVQHRGVDPNTAAGFGALFLIGITIGRFLNGFIVDRLGDKRMIRMGILIAMAGILMVLLPITGDSAALAGLIIVGLGCAPVYPCIIHSTPANFGAKNSQAIVGIQMACAYMGTTFMPPLFGVLAERFGMGLYPFYLMAFAVLMLIMTEKLNRGGIHGGQD